MTREDVRIPSGDGTLAGWLYLPAERSGSVPGVVLMHGFSATRYEQLDRACERLAAAGIAALAIDFRHFGESSGQPRQLLSLARQYEDCDAALAWLRARPEIDPARIAVWGTSFAGGHALDAAARHPWLAAAVCQTPMLDGARRTPGMTTAKLLWAFQAALRDRARAALGLSPHLVPVLGPPGSFAVITSADAWESFARCVPPGSPWRNEVAARILLELRAHRPVLRAKEVRCPLLVQIVGHETVTANESAERAAARAPRATLLRYPGLHHFDVYVGDGFERLSRDQIAFLRDAFGIEPATRDAA